MGDSMTTPEEKAKEILKRWQELYPAQGPTTLSVADIRAAKKQLLSTNIKPSGGSLCPQCKSGHLTFDTLTGITRCRDCKAWRSVGDEPGTYRTGGEPINSKPPWTPIDWEEWRKNMGSAINKTAILLEGVARGNRNPRLENLRAPVLWFEGIAVGERPEYEFQMWSVVPPQGCEITFFGEQAKDRAIKMAQLMLDDGKKK
jgi:hypothetical protein